MSERLIHVQNLPDILDPAQKEGLRGFPAELVASIGGRSLNVALTGDAVVALTGVPEDQKKYLAAATGENPSVVSGPKEVPIPLFTHHVLAPLRDGPYEGYKLNPYIQSKPVATFSEETDIPLAYTPAETVHEGVVDRANDKVHFRTLAPELGIPVTPQQEFVDAGDPQLIDLTRHIIETYGGAFVQANNSGGGIGNIDIKKLTGGDYKSKLGNSPEEIERRLRLWAKEMDAAGSDKIIVAPYLDLIDSHTVSGFIPKAGEGDPIMYGLFRQAVNESNDYAGFEYPARDQYTEKYGQTMMDGARNWFLYLQAQGYEGPSDVDYIVGSNPVLGEVLAASESNTRWDGFRFGMQHLARREGWNLRNLAGIDPENSGAIRTLDHLPTRGGTTTEVVNGLRESGVPLLGITNMTEGAVVLISPADKTTHHEVGLSVIADDPHRTRVLFEKAAAAIKPK